MTEWKSWSEVIDDYENTINTLSRILREGGLDEFRKSDIDVRIMQLRIDVVAMRPYAEMEKHKRVLRSEA